MFRFFRSKPPTSAETTESPDESTNAKPRTAVEWLNADVGELFFGKKAVAKSAPTELPAAAPVVADPSGHVPGAPSDQSVRAASEASEVDRSGWLARLTSGLQRTGSTLAGAFVGAEIGDELYEDLEVALLQVSKNMPSLARV